MRTTIVGGGLAGCECAWQLAERGVDVTLVEQKPGDRSPVHTSDGLAELVCSNSLRGAALHQAVGLLKEEMRRAGSLVLQCADHTAVPAGGALAVDRERFGAEVTARLRGHARIEIEHRRVDGIPADRPVVIATGPLTSDALAEALVRVLGREHLAYYDAIAPVVSAESIDRERVFEASRYDHGGDAAYLNCPLSEEAYRQLVADLLSADQSRAHAFEDARFFEGCLPVEVMAARGPMTLAFGPLKPVGLRDPRTGRRPFAVVQLRREDVAGTAHNLVGFQTRLTRPEQQRILRTIPGLEAAEILRYGSIHRNTFVEAPQVLDDTMQLRALAGVYLAGQITGVEGYVESAASGLVVGTMLAAELRGETAVLPPPTTALGALLSHTRRTDAAYQPSNIMWSMFPPMSTELPQGRRGRRQRREALSERALADVEAWLASTTRAAGPAPVPAEQERGA